ncbi:MAG: gfo/Idh/MocA family oxidoreductase [Spirochaetaceae bacterium]|nr:MAG: gfo/Idh/MocA family oxidoreductase [Spirochaetaceae bacterium]
MTRARAVLLYCAPMSADSDRVGIGVIGCGGMGMAIVSRVLARDKRFEVTAVYDPDERSVARALGEISTHPDVCTDHRAVVDRPDVNLVMIASWNRFHADQTVDAFHAGKHVFCQKPMATTIEDCARMQRAWRESGAKFTLGFTLRYAPHYRKIQQLVASGAIGDLISLEFNETIDFNHGGYIMGDWRRLRENAGTHLLEKCCHDIDLINWITASRAKRVASFGGLDFFVPEGESHIERIGPSPDGKEPFQTWRSLVGKNPFTSDKDIFDNQVAIIEYDSGVRAAFHANSMSAIPERRMYLQGSEGAIRADLRTGTIELRKIGWDTPTLDEGLGRTDGHGGGDDILADELVASTLHGTEPSAGVLEGLESTATCLAIDEAADTGQVVGMGRYWGAFN